MELLWNDSNLPYSKEFDDIYYADESGLDEGRYLFLKQNKIAERMCTSKRALVIGELGFGTGLNFLSVWDLWEKVKRESPLSTAPWVHFLSCEKYPLAPDQMKQALSRWTELAPLTEKFLKAYQDLPQGFHRILFSEHRISLTLFIGDAAESLRSFQSGREVDVWFFCGFAPRKNPEMWDEKIFSEVAKLSGAGTTFSTFTCAGYIRRTLSSLGFHAEKFEGFGRKREMVRGFFTKHFALSGPQKEVKSVTVIGGGLSGFSIAHHLARRGVHVQVIERNSGIASEASGNPAALTLPILTAEPTVLSRMSLGGFLFLRNWIQELGLENENFQRQNILQLAGNPNKFTEKFTDKFEKRKRGLIDLPESLVKLVNASEASSIAQTTIKSDAIYFQDAFILNLKKLCDKILETQSQQIKLKTSTNAVSFLNSESSWKVFDSENNLLSESDAVVFANAYDIQKFSETSWLPLRKIRGQVAHLESSPSLEKLKSVLCFENYLSPKLVDGTHVLGATYDNDDLSIDIRETENLEMIENLKNTLPDFKNENFKVQYSRVSFRTSVPGQAPVVGDLRNQKAESLQNAYVLTSLGSRGSVYAPIAAETLASQITGDPSPIERDLAEKISPERFLKAKPETLIHRTAQ
ncbi:MAG: bifunctional tRNA (5-methylaminomethyl-2-thiouridine)(34)-methyltransferase MnmD/FAD-dependent 5-carboxymethylaminomethyl-2-thiouridine(34) oxidoreductase MnmC [Deltaproteobacteria bacterium]|nr:bifunctional tRNA (5-methylaminomethyl-2-thiouridine)(34)-methyltransferase MnmD/FAD-dependent 5-carboxymethylaminomethyl-2-thiouridine(34) oxidoreductase MnmC [Deltaproteobacteria bacterium]